MLGRLNWLECRLWLAVAGITRFLFILLSYYHLLFKDQIKSLYVYLLLFRHSCECHLHIVKILAFSYFHEQHTAWTSRLSRLGIGHVSPLHPHARHPPLPLPWHRHRRHVRDHAVPQQHQVCLVMEEILLPDLFCQGQG